jgi:Domain of unknown function (DUF1893).
MKQAKALLKQTEAVCVLVREDGTVLQSELSGVRPLLEWLGQGGCILTDACIADKVVGKAAALLMLHGGIGEVYAELLSDSAAVCLEHARVPFTYGEKVPCILNRDRTGMCPMEQRCLNIGSPREAYEALSAMVGEVAHGNN